jgi:hypothetical protein
MPSISSFVIISVNVPKYLVNSAIFLRRLKSSRALTTASRFVFAPVNFIASDSSLSGISIVVFMLLNVAEEIPFQAAKDSRHMSSSHDPAIALVSNWHWLQP